MVGSEPPMDELRLFLFKVFLSALNTVTGKPSDFRFPLCIDQPYEPGRVGECVSFSIMYGKAEVEFPILVMNDYDEIA